MENVVDLETKNQMTVSLSALQEYVSLKKVEDSERYGELTL